MLKKACDLVVGDKLLRVGGAEYRKITAISTSPVTGKIRISLPFVGVMRVSPEALLEVAE